MRTRRVNRVVRVEPVDENEPQSTRPESAVWSLGEAKRLFLKDLRALARHTQRWHRENITALEKILAKQGIVIQDGRDLTSALLKDHFVFYMLDTLHLKANTINGRVRSVRKLLQFMHREGMIRRDDSADVPLIKGEQVIIQTFTQEQLVHLLRQPDRQTFTGLRDYTLMLLLLETGIRISECLGATLPDLDLKAGHLLVHGKGGKQRRVPFQTKMRRALTEYLEARGGVATDALFVTVDGEASKARHIQEAIREYGRQAKITGVRVSPHTFRHTMAKFYILAGGDVFTLQRILGHRSLETVRLYVDMYSSDVQQQHSRFSLVEHQLP